MPASRVVLSTLAALLLAATTASADPAPGLTFPFDATATVPSVDVFAPDVGVARPDGTVVLAGIDRGAGLLLVAIRRDGTFDPTFGNGGIAHVPVRDAGGLVGPFPGQVLRRPDGRLLVLFTGSAPSRFQSNSTLIASLTPQGALDPSFGTGGIADPGIQGACFSGCTHAALSPDGSLIVTGSTGQASGAIGHDPDFHWVVARLTTDGALDPAFGTSGMTTLASGETGGSSVGILPDGSILASGAVGRTTRVAHLSASGTPDPSYGDNGRADAGDASGDLVARPDGSVDLVGRSAMVRLTPAGRIDTTFGNGGRLALRASLSFLTTALRARPGGGELLFVATGGVQTEANPQITVTPIAPDGTPGAARTVIPGFGGGIASSLGPPKPVPISPVAESGYRAGDPVVRPDDSVLVPGGVGVIQYLGEGDGFMHEEEAALSLAPDLTPEASFGGTPSAPNLALALPPQRARTAGDPQRSRVDVTTTTSGPGLVRLRVRAGSTVLADSTAPAMRAGRQRLHALLTVAGRHRLRHARHVRVTVRATFRDLHRQAITATARGLLR